MSRGERNDRSFLFFSGSVCQFGTSWHSLPAPSARSFLFPRCFPAPLQHVPLPSTFMVTNILELPLEILDLIFQYIIPFRLYLRLVCKAFAVAGKQRRRASFESLFIFVEHEVIIVPNWRSLRGAGSILAYIQSLDIRLHYPSSPDLSTFFSCLGQTLFTITLYQYLS